MSIEFFNENYRHVIETDASFILFYAHPEQGEDLIQFYENFLEKSTVQENFILLTLLPCYNVENTSIYAPSIILNEDVLEKTRAAYYPTALRAFFIISP